MMKELENRLKSISTENVSRADFYVKLNGDVIPSTGCRLSTIEGELKLY